MRKLRTLFQFEPKFGWSELIAWVALVIAVIAFYQGHSSGRPRVVVTELPIAGGRVLDDRTGKENFVAVVPFLFTNAGGSTTSLVTLGTDEEVPLPPLMGMWKGKSVPEDQIAYQFFLLPEMVDNVDGIREALLKRKAFEPQNRPMLNVNIPAGESRELYLGIIADLYGSDRRKADGLILSLGARFTHGISVPLRGHIDVSAQ